MNRRRDLLKGALALPFAAGAILRPSASDAATVLSTNDARLVALADAYEALERACDAHTEGHRGQNIEETQAEFDLLVDGFIPLEEEIAATPAASMIGIMAKARTMQVPTCRNCAEGIGESIADDVWRLFGGGAYA